MWLGPCRFFTSAFSHACDRAPRCKSVCPHRSFRVLVTRTHNSSHLTSVGPVNSFSSSSSSSLLFFFGFLFISSFSSLLVLLCLFHFLLLFLFSFFFFVFCFFFFSFLLRLFFLVFVIVSFCFNLCSFTPSTYLLSIPSCFSQRLFVFYCLFFSLVCFAILVFVV